MTDLRADVVVLMDPLTLLTNSVVNIFGVLVDGWQSLMDPFASFRRKQNCTNLPDTLAASG
jgi:hypothetical protein